MPILHHTGLTVADLDRSVAFYRDAVGLKLAYEVPEAGRPASVGFRSLGLIHEWNGAS